MEDTDGEIEVNLDHPAVKLMVKVANRLNPITSGPAAPLQTSAALDSFGPSLMPRSSLHQGIAGGLAVLSARVVGLGVDALIRLRSLRDPQSAVVRDAPVGSLVEDRDARGAQPADSRRFGRPL